MKVCAKCGTLKSKTEFSKNSGLLDGLQSWCRECAKNYHSSWRKENKEKLKVTNAEYRIKNLSKTRSACARWRKLNQDYIKEYTAQWAARHKDRIRIKGQNYRARKLKSGGKLSKNIAEKLFKLQRGLCACCGEKLGRDYHLDHIIPLILGGENNDRNIQLLKSSCNIKKSKSHPIDYMRGKGFLL